MKNLWLFDEKRIAILKKLLQCDMAQGCDLKECVRAKKTLLSYHLGLLREGGIIEEERRGRDKCYRIAPRKRSFVKKVVALVE